MTTGLLQEWGGDDLVSIKKSSSLDHVDVNLNPLIRQPLLFYT